MILGLIIRLLPQGAPQREPIPIPVKTETKSEGK